MSSNYEKIISENLARIYGIPPDMLIDALPALREDNRFRFRAFGEDCCITPEKITLSGRPETGPKGLLISLYGAKACPDSPEMEPFLSFRDLPDSMPYQGAFSMNSERVLIPFVPGIKENLETIVGLFDGKAAPSELGGDFSFVLFPLPKIALCYIFYLPDDEFPSSVTCLFSNNALTFMPLDGLADVGEYTSRRIMDLIG